MDGQCHKNCLSRTLNGLKIFLNLMKVLKKNYNEERDKGYFLEADVQYSENLHNLHHDLPEGIKIESVK